MSYCLVEGCRHSRYHVTQGHRCFSCGNFGHGPRDCGNNTRITNLQICSSQINLPQNEQCSIHGCRFKYLHKTEGHICHVCNRYGHAPILCPNRNYNQNNQNNNQNISSSQQQIYSISCPYCRKQNVVSLENDIIFGLDYDCKICSDNKIDIRLPVCKHAMCSSCVKTIYQHEKNNQNDLDLELIIQHPQQIEIPEPSDFSLI